MSFPIKLDPRPEYHRAQLKWSLGEPLPVAVSTGHQQSSRLLSMQAANALLLLPAKTEQHCAVEKDDIVQAILL